MAYMCKKNYSKECDGCQECMPEIVLEKGVTITAKIELKFTATGRIEMILRKGRDEEAQKMADELVRDAIEYNNVFGEGMSVESVEVELNE